MVGWLVGLSSVIQLISLFFGWFFVAGHLIIGHSVGQPPCESQSVGPSVGWSLGCLVGLLAYRSPLQSFVLSIDPSVGCFSVGWSKLAFQLVGPFLGQSLCRSANLLVASLVH